LAEEIRKEFPELESYVDDVIQNTGGVRGGHDPVKHENNDQIRVD